MRGWISWAALAVLGALLLVVAVLGAALLVELGAHRRELGALRDAVQPPILEIIVSDKDCLEDSWVWHDGNGKAHTIRVETCRATVDGEPESDASLDARHNERVALRKQTRPAN